MCASADGKGISAGKLGSLLIMLNGTLFALLAQYVFGPRVRPQVWREGECSSKGGGGFEHECLAQQGVFRVSMALAGFFITCAVGCRLSKAFHNALWPLKLLLVFAPLMIGMMFVPAEVVDAFVWVARCGAAVFVVLQMVVIVDLAYAVNDWFVAQSNADSIAGYQPQGDNGFFTNLFSCGGLDEALTTLLSISLLLFASAITGIVLLFVFYSACRVTTAFVAMTLVLCVAATVTQLFAETGNLLTSASVSAYAVFVAYTAVSRIPNRRCNPFLRKDDILGIVLGLCLALISLAWTTHSTSAAVANILDTTENPMSRELVSRSADDAGDAADDDDEEIGSSEIPAPPIECLDGGDTENVRFNLSLVLVAMYIACQLTSWGTWTRGVDSSLSSPLAGSVASWMNISAVFVIFLVYFWTLIAPWLFPDRDFS